MMTGKRSLRPRSIRNHRAEGSRVAKSIAPADDVAIHGASRATWSVSVVTQNATVACSLTTSMSGIFP